MIVKRVSILTSNKEGAVAFISAQLLLVINGEKEADKQVGCALIEKQNQTGKDRTGKKVEMRGDCILDKVMIDCSR